MIETAMYALLVILTGAVMYLLARRDPGARVILPGDPLHQRNEWRGGSLLGRSIPIESTHIAWIMLGEGAAGRVHTLYLQSIESLRDEADEAKSMWGPIIAHSIELECDIRGRGCMPVTELLYAVARIDSAGNERWMSKAGGWVNRWSEDAEIREVWPGNGPR